MNSEWLFALVLTVLVLGTIIPTTRLLIKVWLTMKISRSQSYIYYHQVINGYVLDDRRVRNISQVDFDKFEIGRIVVTLAQFLELVEKDLLTEADGIILGPNPPCWFGIPTVLDDKRIT